VNKLLIIILNYRTPGLTVDCLKSLSSQMHSGYFAVVVDNASGDDSQKVLSQAINENGWTSWCQLHIMDRNGGFAWGNNQGLKAGPESEFVLLINSDTIVKEGCLDYCVKVMEAEKNIGAMSCQVLNADGTIQNVTRRLPNPIIQIVGALGLPWKLPFLFGWADIQASEWDRTRAMDVGWVGGAFMMTRGDLVRKIGLLDETFFFYGEDIEFCHRVWKSGFRVHFDPGAQIVHLGGASSGSNIAPDLKREKLKYAAKYNVQRICYGKWAEQICRWTDRIRLSVRIGIYKILGRSSQAEYEQMLSMRSLLRKI
jgi:N-acetylglucosaminyl-diphospho-decaprenol L-rhamnosyltransferase